MNRYRELLGFKHSWVLLTVAIPARIAYGMVALDIFFKTQRATNSIALAGLALGINSIAGALTAGIRGSFMDRYGQTWPVTVLATGYTTMLIVLNFADSKNTILVFAFLLGISAPPINLSIRPLWKTVVPESHLRVAYAADTAGMNMAGVVGPVIATTLSLSSHPESALYLTAAFMFIGAMGLAASQVSRRWRPERVEVKQALFRSKAMQLLALEGAFIGFGWGLFDIAVPAFSTLEGVPHRTAWIFGAMSVANVIGGLIAGFVSKKRSVLRTLRRFYFTWFLVSIPIIFTYPGWTMAVAGFFLGLVGGSIQVFYWEVMELTRPKGFHSAAMGWLWTIEGSIASVGSAVGGWLSATYSPRICFIGTTLCLATGFTILMSGSKTLAAADRAPTEAEDIEAIADVASTNN